MPILLQRSEMCVFECVSARVCILSARDATCVCCCSSRIGKESESDRYSIVVVFVDDDNIQMCVCALAFTASECVP